MTIWENQKFWANDWAFGLRVFGIPNYMISSISGTERGEVWGVFWTDLDPVTWLMYDYSYEELMTRRLTDASVSLTVLWLRWLIGWLIALLYHDWSLTDTSSLTDGLTNRLTKRLLGLLVILVRTCIYSLSSWRLSPKLDFVLIAAFWSPIPCEAPLFSSIEASGPLNRT